MVTNTNTNTDEFTRLVDDLLWVHTQNGSSHDLKAGVVAMIADYTADPDHYSDGSPVGTEYVPDYAPNVIMWAPLPPPHRRQGS